MDSNQVESTGPCYNRILEIVDLPSFPTKPNPRPIPIHPQRIDNIPILTDTTLSSELTQTKPLPKPPVSPLPNLLAISLGVPRYLHL